MDEQLAQPEACIREEDYRSWLRDHGLRSDDVIEVRIRVTRPQGGEIAGWIDAVWFKRDTNGNRYSEDGGRGAIGRSSVPLRTWPRLSPPVRKLG